MLHYLQTRKSIYINISLIFLIVLAWCVVSVQQVVRSFFVEEHLFYGTVSHASIPALFGGTDIPFLDKTLFQINGDANANFVLYSSAEMNEFMADWFDFSDESASEIPLEISAARVNEHLFVVKSFGTSDGSLDWELLVDYQLYYALIWCAVAFVSFIGFLVFLIRGIRAKLPPRDRVPVYSASRDSR